MGPPSSSSLPKHLFTHTHYFVSLIQFHSFQKIKLFLFRTSFFKANFPPTIIKMKASVLALVGAAAVVSAGYEGPSTTSTVYTTTVYTITSCAASVTDCPERGSVTTDYISLYTTVCPVTATETPSSTPSMYPPTSTEVPYTTSTVYITTEYTITACPATVTNCPVGKKTTEILTTTTYCPVSTPVVPPPYMSSSPPSYPVSSPAAPYMSSPAVPPPVLTTVYETTCMPTVITSVYTVTPSPVAPTYPVGTGAGSPSKPYSTGSSAGYPVYPAKNSTITYTGAAGANKVGGLLMAVGLVAALL